MTNTNRLIDHVARSLADSPAPSRDQLAGLLGDAPGLDALVAHVRFAADSYVRVPIHVTPRYEVRLLCWRPGQSSALHHHGASSCAFRVLSGEATELRLDGRVTTLRPGDIAAADTDVTHQVANLGSEPLVTLHVYAPPLPVGQPSPASGRTIVVIGGGLSGTATAIHLLESNDAGLRITLVEGGRDVGKGVAYGTDDDSHLLNVPACHMSVDPAAQDEFLEFAQAELGAVDGHALLPRRLYGRYLASRLGKAIADSPGKLRLARSAATGVRRVGERWEVALADGRALDADHVVLATGHGPTRVPGAVEAIATDARLIRDPYAPGALRAIDPRERILLIGTGLTAIDVLTTLRRSGVEGPVHAVSRGGHWPRPHLATVAWTGPRVSLRAEAAPRTADGLAAWLRGHVDAAEAEGIPWQAVLGAVRAHVSTLWGRLPDDERARFLAEHRARWEILRHRASVASWASLRAWREEGWLVTHAGGLRSVQADPSGLNVDLPDPAADLPRFDRVILCTGHESDPRRFEGPLWAGLIAQGLVAPDPHGLGILTQEDGAVIGESGAVPGLWALGGLQRPRWFESTAVPDLAAQAATLARALVAPAAAVGADHARVTRDGSMKGAE